MKGTECIPAVSTCTIESLGIDYRFRLRDVRPARHAWARPHRTRYGHGAAGTRQFQRPQTGGDRVSLTVSPELRTRAARGEVEPAEFVGCVRESLPYAYGMVAGLAAELSASDR